MTDLILIAILICLIWLLRIEYKKLPKKERLKPKTEPPPLTEEQKREVERQRIELENFWNYDGNSQDDIESQI